MATSINTKEVVNWAYQYNLACAKLTSAQNGASSSATRSKDITTAQASFNATMKSLVPEEAQTSVQFQYFDAYSSYNVALGSATTEKQRQAATDSLLTTLGEVTIPTSTATTTDAQTAALSATTADTTALQPTAAATSAFAAATTTAAAGGTPGMILNAALIGYLVASQGTETT